MNNFDFKNYFYDICKNNNVDLDMFYITNIGKGKNIVYDYRNKATDITKKYIVKFFEKYNAVVIWNRFEHKKTTKKLTVIKKDLVKAINLDIPCVNKGVEYRFWKLTRVYISDLSDIEKLLIKYFK